MALFRPWRSGHVDSHEGAARVIASRGQVLSRECARFRGLRSASYTASDGIFVKALYILLAIILLHDIFAPHPFAPSMILFDGNLSVLTLAEGHQSAAEFVEDDENPSLINRHGTLIPSLSVNFNGQLHPFLHPLLLIAADERPPKA